MWRCPKCSESIEDSFEACWNCQTSKDGTPPTEQNDDEDDPQEVNDPDMKGVSGEGVTTNEDTEEPDVISSNETVLASVGQTFLTSLMTGYGISQTSLMLSDRRIYAAGTSYSAAGKSYVTLVGEVKSLHTVGLEYRSNFWLLVFGIPLIMLYGAGLLLIGMYFITRERYILLNFGGHVTRLSLRGTSNEEVQEFITAAMLAKEGILA